VIFTILKYTHLKRNIYVCQGSVTAARQLCRADNHFKHNYLNIFRMFCLLG
jgi:hypothetical protein